MPDHIDRAAKVIADFNACGHCEGTCSACRGEAEALADAGLLATPEHDAQVAARALRDVVEIFEGDCIELWEEFRWASDAPLGWSENSVGSAIEALSLIGPWLASRADRIEREGGVS